MAIPANQNPAAITAVANASVTNVVSGVQSLMTHGGRNFIVFYLPDLSATPAFSTSPARPLAQLYTSTFNTGLSAALQTALASAPAGSHITIVERAGVPESHHRDPGRVRPDQRDHARF